MPQYLELTEDQMVEELRSIQIIARKIFNAGRANPYNRNEHEKTTIELIKKMNKLAVQGDIV